MLLLRSAGFDASEHETASMSRHGCKLPTGFYRRFARDVRIIAEKHTKGRVVSVLEGGYSDRALCSGAMAHILGLAERNEEVADEWWSAENINKVDFPFTFVVATYKDILPFPQIEKAVKKRQSPRASINTSEQWYERTISLLGTFDPTYIPTATTTKIIPPSTRVLRSKDRGTTPISSRIDVNENPPVPETLEEAPSPPAQSKKLPRVVLKVNPPVDQNQSPSR